MRFFALPAAIKFFSSCMRAEPATADLEVTLETADGLSVPADIYLPKGTVFGTIFSIHGMTPEAWRDPRLTAVNRAFAKIGFRTISPYVDSIANLRIRTSQVDEVAKLVEASLDQVAGVEPFGVFSVSFSGAITLLACARQELASRISGILALGTFADPERCFEYLFDSDDDYGRMIGLANSYEFQYFDNHPIAKGLYRAALDNFYEDLPNEIDQYVSTLESSQVALLHSLLYDPQVRRHTWAKHQPKATELLKSLTVDTELLRPIAGRITLIHGKSDPIISSAETIALGNALRSIGRNPQVLVTPLIGHGDPDLHLLDIFHAPALISVFGGYFSDIAQAYQHR